MKFACVIIFCITALRAFGDEPPGEWKAQFREDAQKIWDTCFDDGRFYPTRLLGIFRTLGSQHDGDRQYEVARLLAVVPHDPYDALLYYLQSPDPYDRAFVIQVIMHLGDRRFNEILKELTKDTTSIKRWDTIVAGGSVGAQARSALDRILAGGPFDTTENPTPEWLEKARKHLAK